MIAYQRRQRDQTKPRGFDVAAALLVANVVFALTFVGLLLLGPRGELADPLALGLGLIHIGLLTLALLWCKRESAGIVYLFVFSNLIIYSQSLIYTYFVPNNGYYARRVTLTPDEIHLAIGYLIAITAAAIVGFKVGELVKPRQESSVEPWLATFPERRVFYGLGIAAHVAHLLLVVLLFPLFGRVWGDDNNLLYLIPLHFVVYNGYVFIVIVLLVDRELAPRTADRWWLVMVLVPYLMAMLLKGEKGAFAHLVLATLVCRVLLGRYRVGIMVTAVSTVTFVIFLFMFPLNTAIKFTMSHPELQPSERREAFTEEFTQGYEGGVKGQIENVSLRLGGVEWFATIINRAEGFQEYFNLTNLGQSLLNTFVPWPGKLYPELIDVGRAMQLVVWGLNFEDTDRIGGYPMLPGWIYVCFGWAGIIVMFFWGVICMVVVRSRLSMVKKLIFTYLFVWSFFLSGDLVPYVKTYVSFLVCLWITKTIVLTTTGLVRSRQPVFVPAHADSRRA